MSFPVNSGLIKMVQSNSITPNDDAIPHLWEFGLLCNTTIIKGVSLDALCHKLFPFLLKARQGIGLLPPQGIQYLGRVSYIIYSQILLKRKSSHHSEKDHKLSPVNYIKNYGSMGEILGTLMELSESLNEVGFYPPKLLW